MRLSILTIIPALVALGVSPAASKDMVINAANYETSHNEGLMPIGACGEACLAGLDFNGDWVEYSFSVSDPGVYETRVYLQGTTNVAFHLQMTLTSEEVVDVHEFDITFTGAGFGWGCTIIAPGGGSADLLESSYTLRLKTFTTAELYVYTINLPQVTSTAGDSWGSIKTIYKE